MATRKLAIALILVASQCLPINAAFAGDSILPNSSVTPGAVNPAVTQADIKTTICKSGWTATIRPSSSYTDKIKTQQLFAGAYSSYSDKTLGDYEEDHLIPLELGGSPTGTLNLWPEPYAGATGARVKDVVETKLKTLVCAGKVSLRVAQAEIAQDWYAAYQMYVLGISTPTVPTPTPAPTTPTSATASVKTFLMPFIQGTLYIDEVLSGWNQYGFDRPPVVQVAPSSIPGYSCKPRQGNKSLADMILEVSPKWNTQVTSDMQVTITLECELVPTPAPRVTPTATPVPVPTIAKTIPNLPTPQITTLSTSAFSIYVPDIAGFDFSVMNLKLHLTTAGGTCPADIAISALPFNVTCAGFSANQISVMDLVATGTYGVTTNTLVFSDIAIANTFPSPQASPTPTPTPTPTTVDTPTPTPTITSSAPRTCWVNGYTRKNGTHVNGYYRSC